MCVHVYEVWQLGSTLLHFLPCPCTNPALSQAVAVYDDIVATLIPPITFSINTTDCLCSSLEELADKIHHPLEHNCVVNPNCTGVTCDLEVVIGTISMEVLIFSCNQPPAMELVIRDLVGNPFFSGFFNESEVTSLTIAGFSSPLSVKIVHRTYSMDIEVSRVWYIWATGVHVILHCGYISECH